MATANTGKFVAYYRVSTLRQGRSGLGLEAQQEVVRNHLNGGDWRLVGEFTEVQAIEADQAAERAGRPFSRLSSPEPTQDSDAFVLVMRDADRMHDRLKAEAAALGA